MGTYGDRSGHMGTNGYKLHMCRYVCVRVLKNYAESFWW